MNNSEAKKILSAALTAIIVLSTLLPASAGVGTINVTMRDASTGTPIPNSTVWFANSTNPYDQSNLWMENFEYINTSANGIVVYNSANNSSSSYHFIKAIGGDNLSTSGADYGSFSASTALQFLNLNITRYDVNDIQNFNITYVNDTYIEVDVPVKSAANLSVTTTNTPLPFDKGVRATKLEYETCGYSVYATEESYELNRTIPTLNTSWSISDEIPDDLPDHHGNITTIYGGDNNETMRFTMQLNATVVQWANLADYEYRLFINTTDGNQEDFSAEYNGSTSISQLVDHTTDPSTPVESNIATIIEEEGNLTFVFDRSHFASASSLNVSARTVNITEQSINDTIGWQQYYFNTAYSLQRNYNFSVTTTTDDIVVKNSTGWVNYSKLSDLVNMPLEQGTVTPVSLTLEKGYNVTFVNMGSSLPNDLTIEVRNHSTNDGAPFNDSIITLIKDYNQSYGFYENVSLPDGTYDFVFKSQNNISTWNSTTISGGDVVVYVPDMPAMPEQRPCLDIMPDVIKVGKNISGQIRNMPDSSVFNATNYYYYIYNASADKTVKLALKKNGTLASSSFSFPSSLPAGEYSFMVVAQNTSAGVNQSLQMGNKIVLVNTSLDFFMNFMTEPSGTVSATITARNSSWAPIPNMKIDMNMIDPSENRFWTTVKASNTTGADGSTVITFTAPPKSGIYFLRFTGSNSSSSDFARDYRPLMVQDFRLEAYPDKEMYELNDPVTVNIRATYFNGTPVQGATINTTVRPDPESDWDNVTYLSESTTDDNGKATVSHTIDRTGECMFELTASKGAMHAYGWAFAFVPLYDITLTTDKMDYSAGDKVNITVTVKDSAGDAVTGLNFYNSTNEFTEPFEVVEAAMGSGKNGTAFVFNPMEGWVKTVNLTAEESSYTGSYNTTDLPGPGFYDISVILFDQSKEGMPTAFAFTDFDLRGNLRVEFSPDQDIFKPYKIDDNVNLSVIVTYLDGTGVTGGTLNYTVGMPWEIFMPEAERERMGLGGPRIDTNTTIDDGAAWINFTLDSSNFTGNTSVPEFGMKEIGTPPFIIAAVAHNNSDQGTEVFPIFITELDVRISTDKFMYNPGEQVTFSINVTNTTGPVDVTFQTPFGGVNEMEVFGPTADYRIAVTRLSKGNYTATYNTNKDVAGEHFGFAMVTDEETSAGKGVPFFVKSFDVTLTLSPGVSVEAGDTITATVSASGVETPATVDVALFSPTNKILYFSTGTLSTPFDVSIPESASPGLYSIKSRVEGADGDIGAAEKFFAVTNSGINVALLIRNASGVNTTSFALNDVVNMTIHLTGINSTTIRVFNESGLVFRRTGMADGASTQFVPTASGIYYVRVDTANTIGLASKAFVVT